MYNEIFRKITSLTLLTILLASSAVIALPNTMPAAHAQVASHPNLFVSAENSQYNNYFAGPQVIQVIVSDPNINRLDQQFGEPIVTVAGKRLRMAQGTDGNWYGYFADRNQAELAAKTAPVSGQGLNFGFFCAPGDASALRSGLSFTDTKGFTVARGSISGAPSFTITAGTTAYGSSNTGVASPFQNGFPSGGSLTNACNFGTSGTLLTGSVHIPATENVVRENKTLNSNPSGYGASTALSDAWPIIQLYDFSGFPQSVPVDYSAAGGDQIATLTFDRIPSQLISVTPDRTSYPENAQVFLTMNDPQLNIDPSEDDVWTWGANPTNNTAFYHAFDRNANLRADGNFSSASSIMPNNGQNGIVTTGTPAMQNLINNMSSNFMFNHNGKFTFTPTAQSIRVVDFQNFGREKLVCNTGLANQCISSTRGSPDQVQDKGLDLAANSRMITFAEQGGVNTGVFGDWDGSRNAGIVTLSPSEEAGIASVYPAQGSIRGQSSTFKYNDISGSIVGGFAFGSITVTPTNGTWPSGTRIPVTLTDMDENKNGKLTEHLNDYSATVDRITAMKIGTPFSINAGCGTNNAGCSDPSIFVSSTSFVATTKHVNGSATITYVGSGTVSGNFSAVSASTDPDLGVDESFSNRVVPAFTQAAGGPSSVTLSNTGGVLIDTGATMQTLLNTIHNPNGGSSNAATRFHGFNFLNFDLRSFTTLNNATGTPSAVKIYLVYGPVQKGTLSTSIGAPSGSFFANIGAASLPAAGVNIISLVNDTNMEDFVNLNGTTALSKTNAAANPSGKVDTHGDFYIPGQVDNGSLVMQRIMAIPATDEVGFLYVFNAPSAITLPSTQLKTDGSRITAGLPMVTDFFSIGIIGDGTDNSQRINNGIYRWELEETGDNTGVFTGTTQYLMLNQLNLLDPATYTQLRTINHDVLFVAIQDMLQSEARAPQATYFDLGADGVNSQISAQQDIPTHTGTVSFDQKTYKVADTVTVTVNDPDLNTNNDLVVIYSTVAPSATDPASDTIGKLGLGTYSDGRAIGRLLDIQFGQQDIRWTATANANVPGSGTCFTAAGSTPDTQAGGSIGLQDSGFNLVETAAGSGIFTGTFEVPGFVCTSSGAVVANGLNMKVNYVDFRDQSGKLVEVSDNAGIRGNTGSVKLDKAVYPVPFGGVSSVVDSGKLGSAQGAASASFGLSTTSSSTTVSNVVLGNPSANGVFPLHRDLAGTGIVTKGTTLTTGATVSNFALGQGNVIVHARVNDPDYTLAPTGTNFINVPVWGSSNGPVAFQISRQGQSVLLATAGGPAAKAGTILDLGTTQLPQVGSTTWNGIRDLGPMTEISPGAGIFQADLPIELTDGPRGQDCPTVDNFDAINGSSGFLARNDALTGTAVHDSGEYARFTFAHTDAVSGDSSTNNYCVRQGDVLTVTYRDTSDASGNPQTVTDSATFDLRNGVLQSDKSVYIIGSDMILTLVEPDFNLDSQTAETLPLDLIEWDSHAFKGTMGPLADGKFGPGTFASFDAKPSTFVETGKDTGIFQAVIKIPKQITTTLLERGEQINLEYTDWGPAGSKTVGANNQDIELTIYTSNFGATVELDQKVYTWTDRVYMTVVAPDHNFDPNLIDTIGNNGGEDLVTVSTRGHSIFYKLAETGVDTGIFTGYVILSGDPSINPATGSNGGGVDGQGEEPTGTTGNGNTSQCTQSNPCGPTDGFLQAEDSDGISVSFEFTRDQTVTGSALIRWNIGEISWLQSSYPANGQGVLQIVDPDMNLNPKAVDKFNTNVWSDSDSGGIQLTMTETGQDTGIFQGTVYFTTNFGSSGNRLHVSEGDTVTGEYKDRTLPPPYTPADQLRLTSTTFIGTIVPPLERAPATNPRIVDSFGNAINGTVKVGQQIQVTADLANGQSRDQPFAYLVQIQDANGVTVSLSWITGTLSAGQSLNPAQSWTPSTAGTYTAQIFVWQSIDNPNALSPPLSTTINVQ